MSIEKEVVKTCEERGGHIPSEQKYGVPMRRQERVIVIDICKGCGNSYSREPSEEEAKGYEAKENFLRERGFNI